MRTDEGRPQAAMILAAGRGERMRPLTDTIPKPLLTVRGSPLIDYHVRALAAAGIRRIVVNLHWLGAQIREYLGDGMRYGVAITYSEESPRALDAGGGIFRALPALLPGPFIVVNGDVFCDLSLGELRINAGFDAHLILVPNPLHHAVGDFGLRKGLAVAAAAEKYTYSGIAIYRANFFDGCSEGAFPLKPLLLRSMAAQRCAAQVYAGLWADVGTPERLLSLNAGVQY